MLDRVGLVQKGVYSVFPDISLARMIQHFRNILKNNNITDPERVSEIMYNSIVNGVKQNEQVNENEDVDEDYRPLTDKQIKSIEDLFIGILGIEFIKKELKESPLVQRQRNLSELKQKLESILAWRFRFRLRQYIKLR